MVVTKINIKPHLAEYMRAKFWDPEIQAVRLPDKDDLYITIYNLTSKRPANAGIDDGNLPIAIPHRREGKNPACWNYLGVRATVQIESLIEVRFWAELHQYLDEQKHRYNIDYIASIEVFMNRYDIQSISDEALINVLSGKGTWESNPYVFVYDFESSDLSVDPHEEIG